MKKNYFYFLAGTLAFLLSISGCGKKDEPTPAKTNSFSWHGTTYDTPKVSVAKYLYNNTFSGAFMVALNSASLDFKIDSGSFYYSNNNVSSYNYFLFFLRPSLNATSLTSGTYTVNLNSPTLACYGGAGAINNNLSTSGSNFEVLTGSITVTKVSDSNYTFDYNFNLKDKTTLTGYYSGTVTTGTFNYVP